MVNGLESANLKLIRAAKHIEAIRDLVWDYVEREPSAVTKESNGSYALNFREPPPHDIAILVGEVLYQVRSALDHLTFDLVKLNSTGIQLPLRWEKRCEFPLLTQIPTKANPPVPFAIPLPYNYFSKTLPGITVAAFTFIESLQPYHRGNSILQRNVPICLGWLAELSNIDKHRHLNLIWPQIYYRSQMSFSGGTEHASIQRVQDGAEIKPDFPPDVMANAVKVYRGFTPFVSFDEKALGAGASTLPVDHILQSCLDAAQIVIIPAFEQLLKKL